MFLGALVAPFFMPGPVTAGPNLATPTGCATPKQHNDLVRHALRFSSRGGDYKASSITRRQLERLGAMRACAKRVDPAAYNRMRGFWDRRSDRWAFHRHIDAITPYGEWAVPPHIVARESGGSYTARNPTSTAGGAYQQLDTTFHSVGGTDYPGSHDAAQAPPWEQHITAARLWNGGAGASHWALTY